MFHIPQIETKAENAEGRRNETKAETQTKRKQKRKRNESRNANETKAKSQADCEAQAELGRNEIDDGTDDHYYQYYEIEDGTDDHYYYKYYAVVHILQVLSAHDKDVSPPQ
jgi:hypothetical protein